MKRLESLEQALEISIKYEIPIEDIIFIDLNRCGIITKEPIHRIRVYLTLTNQRYFNYAFERQIVNFFFVLSTNTNSLPYNIHNGNLRLNNEIIGIVNCEDDSCDLYYFRKNKTVLNLNTQYKSTCNGCSFCHTEKQTACDLVNIKDENRLAYLFNDILFQNNKIDLSKLLKICVVTGCFGNENRIIRHLMQVREITDKLGYIGEIFYLGSEIKSKSSIEKLTKIKPFSICISIDCFIFRKKFLKKHKSDLTLTEIKDIFQLIPPDSGKNFTYILGLEPLSIVLQGIKDFKHSINRFPIINIFQPHGNEHIELLCEEALDLDYFLIARKSIEQIFKGTNLRPLPWENYRCLWYLKFDNEDINEDRLP